MSGATIAPVTELVAAARARVRNLSPEAFAAELAEPETVLVDVREPAELVDGVIAGAIAAPRGMLEFHADPSSPYHLEQLRPERRIRLYCKSGGRSALAAASLVAMGYADVAHLDGGVTGWTASGHPLQTA